MQEKQRQVYDLLEITNRQFNECNALYHAVAQRSAVYLNICLKSTAV